MHNGDSATNIRIQAHVQTFTHTFPVSFSLSISLTHTLAVYSLSGRLTNSCRPPSFLITPFLQSKVCNATAIAFRPCLSSESFSDTQPSVRTQHSLSLQYTRSLSMHKAVFMQLMQIKLFQCEREIVDLKDWRVTLGT